MMLSVVRKETIKNKLLENKTVSIKELSELMNVTEETIRRDLKDLEKEGVATRTHGGAFLKERMTTAFSRNDLKKLFVPNKVAMAKLASKYLHSGSCIFLDASSTVYELTSFLEDSGSTIVTNSLDVLNVLSEKRGLNVVGVGGMLDNKTRSFNGPQSTNILHNLYFDVSFISCRTLSLITGFADGDCDISELKHIVVDHSKKLVVLADHTKFDKISFSKICDIERANVLVTDFPVSKEWEEYINKSNIELIIASDSPEIDSNKLLK
ncbi:MAG: DeoR/GlpR transcriptional regulator [Sphaerochaetaceae bacterium]|nr:DeoR/GlpR transcriptional regulator [Sphaerochaetaceae bacterium]